MKRSKEKWESSIRVKEDTEEHELTSGGREFHRRHDEGMKEERYKEEEQAGSSTVPVLRRLYSHRLFTDFGMREERQGGPWLFTSFHYCYMLALEAPCPAHRNCSIARLHLLQPKRFILNEPSEKKGPLGIFFVRNDIFAS